ncbi:MAG: UDP-N-acetylglucosamine--N-acetylmuramyl-(pentapeptide) pyrophosphoryl-undecaprenol [Deltaproteobacteria bacterium]|nr:UDP-N-acetylglucosamine--N-acetylmuramyl-(pentapeptide) pyrophosphoryl-undecaprenol [Deltaproteobacteria bacterium]
MKLLIAGGGTGGHLFPGIAVAEEFLGRDPANEVLFVGTERGVEARVLPRLGYRLELIAASGLRGKSLFSQLKGVAGLLYGYSQSRKILKAFRPDVVLGVGGYASAPVLLAARGLLLPRYIHEQNAIPGMSNKLLSRVALKTFISLEESRRFFPKETTLLTGNPLRRQILEQVAGRDAVHPGEDGCHLLVFGGSLGAHSINMAMAAAAPLLARLGKQLTITHQTGEKDEAEVRSAYAAAGLDASVVPFIDDMAEAYHRADLIVCRAGATTIAEVTACGKACIFIPFPHAVDDHQRRNAEALLKSGAGFMLLERELAPESLARQIGELLTAPQLLRETGDNARSIARLDAAVVIVDEMLPAGAEVKG